MRLDRAFYSVGDAMALAANELAPIRGRLTPIRPRDTWFAPGAWDGKAAFSAIWFGDYAHWFAPGNVGGAFCPCWTEPPGERVGVFPPTVEEAQHKRIRDLVYLQAREMARAGEIRPTSGGVYVRVLDGRTVAQFERLTLTDADAGRVLATFLTIDAPAAREGAPLKKAALVRKHLSRWPTIERDLRDAPSNGLRAAAQAEGRGMWWERDALAWAEPRGKLPAPLIIPIAERKVHRLK